MIFKKKEKEKERGKSGVDRSCVAAFCKTNSGATLKWNFWLPQSEELIKRNWAKALIVLSVQKLLLENCISKARTKRRRYTGLQDVLGGFPILIYWINYKTQWINNTNMQVNVTLILLSIPLVRLQRCNRERLKSAKSKKNIILLFPCKAGAVTAGKNQASDIKTDTKAVSRLFILNMK